MKDDHPIQAPISTDKLSNVEIEVLAKYFGPTGTITWRPSLIAFPHFQAFPTGVHKVPHSFRTEILIDTMQYLQGLSFSGNSKTFFDEVSSRFFLLLFHPMLYYCEYDLNMLSTGSSLHK